MAISCVDRPPDPVYVMDDHDWLVVWNLEHVFFHILGMSSSQLTNVLFFRGVG